MESGAVAVLLRVGLDDCQAALPLPPHYEFCHFRRCDTLVTFAVKRDRFNSRVILAVLQWMNARSY